MVDAGDRTNEDASCGDAADRCPRHLFRAVEKPQASHRDYKTQADRGKLPPEGATAEEVEAWGALSAWDSEAKALEVGRRSVSNDWVVRYDIPEDSPIRCKASRDRPGHYDVYVDQWTQLHDCLAPGRATRIDRAT